MLIEDLKHTLIKEFDIVCFVDLSEVQAQHRLIFDIFRDARLEYFEPNQRLIFYTSRNPEQKFLDHIQRAATRIDISNYFILIVCPWDIKEKLAHANKKFGNDDQTIQSLIHDLTHTKPFAAAGFARTDTLCPLPFSQIVIDTTGAVSPCCKFQAAIGDSRKTTLQKIFFGKSITAVRKQMILGKKPKECNICWQNEHKGTTSFRQLAWQKYGDSLEQHWLDDIQIRDVTWSPSSLCNFKCRICQPLASTSLAAEEIRFTKDRQQQTRLKTLMIDTANPLEHNQKIIDSLCQLKHVNYLHILGGEPFKWPQLGSLIDQLIQQDLARHLALELNTNCSVFEKETIERIIRNFRTVEILLSVDNTEQRFEVERGSNWSDVLSNLKQFASLKSPTVQIKLATTVNLQNVLYLDDVRDLAKSLGLDILWWYLEKPDFLCIDNPTDRVKQLVVEKYQNHIESELRKIASRMRTSQTCNDEKFIEHAKKLDLRRGQNFSSTHKEIYDAMGGCFSVNTVL